MFTINFVTILVMIIISSNYYTYRALPSGTANTKRKKHTYMKIAAHVLQFSRCYLASRPRALVKV